MMPFRLLRYIVRIWDRWLQEHEGATHLPAVLPMVLYHGRRRWTAPTELTGLLDAPAELLDALGPYQPALSYRLEDLSTYDEATLATLRLTALARLVLMLLKHARDPDLRERLPRWLEAFRAVA